MSIESWALILMGAALAIAISSRLRDERPSAPMTDTATRPVGHGPEFHVSRAGVFEVRVVAMEFDEIGPVMYINGEYASGPDRLDIDLVTAEVSAGGRIENFVSFDPSTSEEPSEKRIGDLVNFVSPVMLEPNQTGKFRTPLFAPDSEETLNTLMDRLDGAARRMVEKFDREFDNYSLEGESLARIESDFLNDIVVRELAQEIGREMIWRPGLVSVTMRFINAYEEMIEEQHIDLRLSAQDARTLEGNVSQIILNALRAELDLEMVGYSAVVFEN